MDQKELGLFRRNRVRKYDFQRNASKTQQIISRKMDEMELNQNHSGQVRFYTLFLFFKLIFEWSSEPEKSLQLRILQFSAFGSRQIIGTLLVHRSLVT